MDEEECKGQGYEDPDTPAARELANDVAAMVNLSLNLSVKIVISVACQSGALEQKSPNNFQLSTRVIHWC